MARIRTIKPELARHEGLFAMEQETKLPIRFAWAMLPTICDREGRFKWRPNDLKLDILPYDKCDFSRVLDAWVTRGYLVKYRVGNAWFGWVPTFRKHQVINNREAESEIPDFKKAEEKIDNRDQALADACATRAPRDDDATCTRLVQDQGEGKGREGKGTRVVDALPEWLDRSAWNDWEQFRRETKNPLTHTSRKKCLELLARHQSRQREIIDKSISSGWRGLFEPKDEPAKKPNREHMGAK